MILGVGVLLVVEVVQQRHRSPIVFVLAEQPRVPAHCGFHREHMFAQALTLRVLRHQKPRVLSGKRHRSIWGLRPRAIESADTPMARRTSTTQETRARSTTL